MHREPLSEARRTIGSNPEDLRLDSETQKEAPSEDSKSNFYFNRPLLQFHNGDACSAELDVLVTG